MIQKYALETYLTLTTLKQFEVRPLQALFSNTVLNKLVGHFMGNVIIIRVLAGTEVNNISKGGLFRWQR